MRRTLLFWYNQESESASADILRECAGGLAAAARRVERVSTRLTDPAHKGVALVNAHDALTLLGHTTAAWMWLRMATAAARALEREAAGGEASRAFYEGKLHTCAFFYRHELPKTEVMAALLLSLDGTVAEMQPGWF